RPPIYTQKFSWAASFVYKRLGLVRGALAVQARAARLDSELVRAVVPAMRIAAGRIAPLFQTTGGTALSTAELRSR
ncbi:hypothetical protein ACFXO7_21175, partial [Nocardia tengchongensis]